ncbi:Phage-related tail fibre protein [Paenibacillus uliginis N3/975]|uniref:Phage-related tail fibre protein n=1 Tax=Paenibacillus uliginis N3/975 TaxID=1313296 RepID=A0A1X7HM18_9BACL|nr:tail fiber protein [Paenibacillus uliginis]SMF88130.1 Phage-related tail fibre protein [Paenibacillus uliginis N3/975]
MGAFGGFIQTNKGRNLQAKAEAGALLKFTRMGVGDGQLGGQSITTLNRLISEKKSLPITRLKTLMTAQAIVGAVLSNQDVTTGFYFREMGIFAQDPDEGEILYAYGNSGSGAEYIPPAGAADIIEKTIDMIVTFGQAQNVSAVINSSLIFATPDDVAESLAEAKKYTDEKIAAIDVDIPDASLTEKGIVQLSNATNSVAENMAATPKAVKAAMDEAIAGKQLGVEQKANVVAALNSIGVQASTNESWAQLIPKISAIIRASGNAIAADLLVGKSASNASGPFNGGMPNRSAENTHMPGLESTVWPGDRFFIRPPQGYYDGGSWVTAMVPGLTANNLRSGVNVAGLLGTLIEGKPFASGSAIVKDRIEFTMDGGGRQDTAYIEVNGLAFVPKRIVVYTASLVSAVHVAETGMTGIIQNAWNYLYGNYFTQTFSGTSFRIPVSSRSSAIVGSTVYWEVYG